MGSTISTLLLMVCTLATGVTSAMAANYGRQKNYDKAKMFSGISIAIAVLAVLLTLFVMIRSHMSPAGEIDSMAIGVNISYILLTISMVAITAMMSMSVVAANDQNSTRILQLGAGSSALSFFMFILSMIIVIFLL